jgi:hypothetical protein
MSSISSDQDVERGFPETEKTLPEVPKVPSSDVLGMHFPTLQVPPFTQRTLTLATELTLQELQTELNQFLVAHTEKVLSLQASLPPMGQHTPVISNGKPLVEDAGLLCALAAEAYD